jgi:ketosteroid isomerase-like protein
VSDPALRDELIRLQNQWADAVQRRDLAFLERLLGEEFTLTTGRPGFEMASRQEWLDVTRDRYVVESFEYLHFDIHVYGDVAVVRSRYRQKGSMDGTDRSTTYLMTDVWVRRDGRWQAVSRHITPLQDG